MRFLRSLGAAVMALLFPAAAQAQPLEVGAAAPAVSAPDQDGRTVALADLYAAGPVLVYFYPKASTPGCTTQACDLRDAFADLQQAGLAVVGVSLDSVEAQKAFHTAQSLPFPLLADTEGAVARGFGVPVRLTFAARQTFLVVDGRIAWRDLSARPSTQAEDALAALRAARGQP